MSIYLNYVMLFTIHVEYILYPHSQSGGYTGIPLYKMVHSVATVMERKTNLSKQFSFVDTGIWTLKNNQG
jgi:hypothetical protein